MTFLPTGNLSGWSTKGKLACPSCNADTDSNWLKYGRKHCYMGHPRFLQPDHMWRRRKGLFNGKEDHRMPPRDMGGYDILTQLQMIGDVTFGKSLRKRKRTAEELNWTKCSNFFTLPYWSTLRLWHNLDVMHIEKNITENVLFTLMNSSGKTKDNINSRRDLELLGYRKELHLRREGDHVTMSHALYTLHGDERKKLCEWLRDIKFPDGFSSNISNCVSTHDCKITGLKSHDCHVFLQRLLPIAAEGFLRSDIALALTELSTFFKELCARTLDVNCLSQLQTGDSHHSMQTGDDIPSLLFRYVETKFNRADRNIDADEEETIDGFRIFNQKVHPLGIASNVQLEDKLFKAAMWYVLNNCPEIGPYIQEHYEKCRVQHPNSIVSTHQTEFATGSSTIQEHRTKNPLEVSADLYALACGPDRWVASYDACIINGKRFHTKDRELRQRTQNSGDLVTGDESTNNADFYGCLKNIIELRYMEWRRVYLFECDWFDVGDRKRGVRVDDHMISVNMSRTWYKDEPFVLASQADQCF
ncbi:uncharacterized protein LOC122298423 [Carya illinoinensis]|uniref:uncharacterized protein LOC122298423 n=1 Tax=Carya illinoinensis TaxID=32201 RepID=UPI001C722D79|nr:uncharacterized protein LOC122298423 [Carya illinoinensis]